MQVHVVVEAFQNARLEIDEQVLPPYALPTTSPVLTYGRLLP